MMSAAEADLNSQLRNTAMLEKAAMGLIDSCLSADDQKSRISDVFNRLHSLAPKQLLEYFGSNPGPPAVAKFLQDRNHLWRSNNGEEIQARPAVLRAAVVDLVASIARNRNRAPLTDVFHLLQRHHPQALPYLPTPTSGSSLEAVKKFMLGFPKLFHLLNADDGSEWTRTTPLGRIIIECVSVVVDGVILPATAPYPISTAASAGTKSTSGGVPDTIEGIAEIVRVTTVWGYLLSEVYGAIFFTAKACGTENLNVMGFRLQQRVYFEASPTSDTQIFNNQRVKWRASCVRHLTPAEREEPEGQLKSVSAEAEMLAAANYNMEQLSSTFSSISGLGQRVSPTLSSTSSPPKPTDAAAMKKLPSTLATWMKKRQESTGQAKTPSPRHSPSPHAGQLRNVTMAANGQTHSAVDSIENELDYDSAGNGYGITVEDYSQGFQPGAVAGNARHGFTTIMSPTRIHYDYVANASQENYRATNQVDYVHHNGMAAAEGYPGSVDVSVQTDVTDEELLLRVLRTAPELLDLVRVVMRQ